MAKLVKREGYRFEIVVEEGDKLLIHQEGKPAPILEFVAPYDLIIAGYFKRESIPVLS